MQKRLAFLVAFMMIAVSSVMAQVTTSAIAGKVTVEGTGEEIIGATVQAVHGPSGTKYVAVTNEKGRYTIQGMRAGGPYTVTVSYIGSQTKNFNNVNLSLGETYALDVWLADDAQTLGEISVIGNRRSLEAGGFFDSQSISVAPTIDRNIYDIVKLNPMASISKYGGMSIAGTNNRYNSFQIDGAVSNDVFGLSSGGTNGGQTNANPISLDAIEQIQVSVAPYDVRQSGFTGGAINAVTKSGTNEFHGSAYGFFNNQGMYGKWNAVTEKNDKMTKQYDETFGATIGGPIIKDKLFFFASGEYKKNSYPSSYYAGMDDNIYFTEDLIQQIANKYEQATGIKESWGKKDIVTQSLGLLARIDWNINDMHKFTFRYQYNGSSQDKANNSATTLYFNNSGYKQTNRTNSFVAELNSRLSNNLSNEARVSFVRVRDWRNTAYQGPTCYILNVPYGSKTNGTINIGTEYSSGVNSLDQDNWTIEDNLTWYKGSHSITFGTHNEIYNMYNGFIQYANGEYYYNNVDNFLNDVADRYYYNYSDEALTGTTKWRANVKAGQFGFYAQDKWDVNDAFKLTYGVRFDAPVFFNKPTANDAFNQSTFASTYNVKVGEVPGLKLMISPRLGFRWYADKEKNLTVRGGTGLFTGRVPFVWISNVYSNTAMEMKSTTTYSPIAHQLGEWQQQLQYTRDNASSAKQNVNTVASNFKYPQTWRSNLAVEYIFPYGIKASLEGLYSKNLNAVYFENLALQATGTKAYVVPGVEASAAPYYSTDAGDYLNIVNLRSINKGYSYSITAKAEKSFDFGLDVMASYTYGHSKSVNDGLSSVALSNWNNYVSVDVNEPTLGYSLFDIPNQIKLTLNYNSKKYLQGMLNTEIGLTYNGSNGMRYCLTMSENTAGDNKKSFNGDGRTGHTLLYIPTDAEADMMNWKSDDDKTKFLAWAQSDDYAKNHRGQYAERFGSIAPWENHFDFHLGENFYYNKKGGKIALSLDITNVANLLNKNWGHYYTSTTTISPLKVESVTVDSATGNRVGTFSYTGNDAPTKNNIYSRWHMQLGLKVTF